MNIIIYTEGEILSRESINLFNKVFWGDSFITSILKVKYFTVSNRQK